MTDWTGGYVADIGYTYGYYTELNPLRVRLAFLNAGVAFPEMGTACELGFGQGLSAGMHAAATLTQWYGTDFNPAQAAFAQELAAESGSNATLLDEAFSEFCSRCDLPDFDYIGLHGIWSWISDENRKTIVDFIRRKLKVGGVLYISYNTLPGWSSFAPVRHLMTEHAEVLGAEGLGIVNRIDAAVEFAERLVETNPLFVGAHTGLKERLAKVKDQNRHYLAHEYFNRDWHPMYFSTIADWLSSAKIQYACSANYLEHIEAINLTAEQRAFMVGIPDPMLRQSVRDFMVNQQFRKDYWVKGLRNLSNLERSELIRNERIVLTIPRSEVKKTAATVQGEVNLNEQIYAGIIDVLADHKVHSLGEVEKLLADKSITLPQIIEMVMVFASLGCVASAQTDIQIAQSSSTTKKLNLHLMQKARSGNDISFLASPVTGGGVALNRFNQLFLLALSQGRKQPAEWAHYVWDLLAMQRQTIVKEGEVLEGFDKNIAELKEQAKIFGEKYLPIMRELMVI